MFDSCRTWKNVVSITFMISLSLSSIAYGASLSDLWNGVAELGEPELVNFTGSPGNLGAFGFDPGMKIRRIASPDLSEWNYFESCPDGPNGKCNGSLSPGSGFYTLGSGCFGTSAVHHCRMNSGEIFQPLPQAGSWTAKCPYYFNWKTEGNSTIANLKIDPRSFKTNEATDFYLGVQENIHYGSLYGGIDFDNLNQTPYLKDIRNVSLKIRTKLCYTSFENEHPRAGSVFYYINWLNPYNTSIGGQIALVLIIHKNNNTPYNYSWMVESIKSELELCGDACKNLSDQEKENSRNTIIANGKYLGIVPQSYDFYIDGTVNCSIPIDNSPWLDINIPVQDVINRLVSEGFLNRQTMDIARYSGGIIAGTEFWGRSLVELEVKDHTMYRLVGNTSTITTTTTSTSTSSTTYTTTTTTPTSSSTTTTSNTTTTSSTSTTSTTIEQCIMPGNYPPCEEVSLSEVVDAINQWALDNLELGKVICLINSWADPKVHPPA